MARLGGATHAPRAPRPLRPRRSTKQDPFFVAPEIKEYQVKRRLRNSFYTPLISQVDGVCYFVVPLQVFQFMNDNTETDEL